MQYCLAQVDLHYNGFCNSVLWQLFHYIPLNLESKLSDTRTLNLQWKAHQEANRKFAEVLSLTPVRNMCVAVSSATTMPDICGFCHSQKFTAHVRGLHAIASTAHMLSENCERFDISHLLHVCTHSHV